MKELSEKDFIHEEYPKDPYPFWIWLLVITTVLVLFSAGRSWFRQSLQTQVEESPFLQVTNRQLSLFLWQYPEHMRAHVKAKTGYLPAFQYMDKVTPDPELADQYVVAPPELLFLFHTWHRLLGDVWIPRPITQGEFLEFLKDSEEWQPHYWREAPAAYKELVAALPQKPENEDLQTLLPLNVKQAFQGWKNYFKEGEKINQVQPTFGEMERFLTRYPHYGRSYWRNLLEKTTPHYLEMRGKPNEMIPVDQLAPFLKVAFFNANVGQ